MTIIVVFWNSHLFNEPLYYSNHACTCGHFNCVAGALSSVSAFAIVLQKSSLTKERPPLLLAQFPV